MAISATANCKEPMATSNRAGHRTKVDALSGRPALHVFDVALQRPQQELPGLLGLLAGQNPGTHHPAQRRTVRGVLQVVRDGSGELVVAHLVAEIPEQLLVLSPSASSNRSSRWMLPYFSR